ncbi:MAG: DUF3592 domain-containing protein [Anaerolineales bacterium]
MINSITTLIGALLSLAGLAFLAGAVLTYQYQARQRAVRIPARGEVIALVLRKVRVGRPGYYCPVVKFRTSTGQEVQFESGFGALPAIHQVGQGIDVLYDPADPYQAEISSSLSRWTVPVAWAAMGVVALCMGSFFLLPRFLP